MAVGITVAMADGYLAQFDPNTYVQVHTSEPGVDGNTGVMASVNRKLVGFGAASTSGGSRRRVNSALLRWDGSDLPGSTNTVTHVSFWSENTAGTFRQSASLGSPKQVTSGEPFEMAAGVVIVSIGPLAS